MVDLHLETSELRPLVQSIISEVLLQMDQIRQAHGDKIAFSEDEAAAMLGLNPWQLRDVRRSGKITHTRIVGNRIRYTRNDLMEYLRQNQSRDAGK